MTKFAKNHSITFGGTVEKFHSDNSFYFGIQSAYSYNSLADFYADANGFLANPNRTVVAGDAEQLPGEVPARSRVRRRRRSSRSTSVYAGGYVQDEWRPKANLTVTAGLRIDVPKFGNTAFDNPVADALTFRDQDGSPVQYNTGALPETTPYWSPRVGFNWDVNGDQATQVRGGTGLFTGQAAVRLDLEPDRQHRRAVRIHRSATTRRRSRSTRTRTSTSRRATGGAAASYELDVTDQGFRFPQTWRTNIGVDRRLPWGLVGTARLHLQPRHQRAGLHQRQPAGADRRVHRRGQPAALGRDGARRGAAAGHHRRAPACAATGQAGRA